MENKILSLYDKLKSAKAVAKKLNIDSTAVCRVLAKNHVTNWLTLNDEEKQIIVDEYKTGKTVKQINDIYNFGLKRITYVLLDNDLMRKRTSLTSKDETIFETIDTEEKAYWLGFLYADGYVNEKTTAIELSLAEIDYEHIVKFKKFTKSDRPIRKKEVKIKNKTYVAYRLTICSKKIVSDLVSKGCFQNKSLKLKFPNEKQVPKHLIHHFMRGYFDGDGCLSISNSRKNDQPKLSLVGTEEFLTEYENNLMHLDDCINYKIPKLELRRKTYYSVAHSGFYQIKDIYNVLYLDSTIYLERKRNKFIAVLTQQP